MTKNTQALILFFASQLSWMVCCAASVPAFVVTTYEETPMFFGVMANGFIITVGSTFLMVLALLVALTKKQEDELNPKRLDPKFSFGMGATVFLLIAQVILSMTHAVWQPDDEDIVAPGPDAVEVFEVVSTMTDGSETSSYGFVIAHPDDGRPLMVTTSQQFSTEYGLDRTYAVSDVAGALDNTAAVPADGQPRWLDEHTDRAVALGEPADFRVDAFMATGYGTEDTVSDVMIFEAPQLKSHIAEARIFWGFNIAPTGQKLFVLDGDTVLPAEFSWDYEDSWEIRLEGDVEPTPGSPVLNWEHEVVGWITGSSWGTSDVFPIHMAYDYLGEPVLLR